MSDQFYRNPELWMPEIAGTHVDVENLENLYQQEEALLRFSYEEK